MARYTSIDDVLASYPTRFHADKAKGMDDRVHMNLTGANARDVTLYVHDGELTVEDGVPAADPTLTLTADADNWLAVENGELNPMMAMMTGKVKMKGSVPFATKFMGLFGYGG
ncbi:MAG TPA: SCP2 sterol-binding domain-containing protein [Rubricoccaceae bacterium]|jgi:putative sterol carrier protein